MHRHFTTLVHAGVHADLRGHFGRQIANQPTDRGQEVAKRILGIDSGLDGPTFVLDVGLPQRQRFAGRNPDHQLHQIQAGDKLSDRVLDLKPGVHLQEIEVALGIDDKLDRPPPIRIPRLRASATACSPMTMRVSSSKKGEGASSMTF